MSGEFVCSARYFKPVLPKQGERGAAVLISDFWCTGKRFDLPRRLLAITAIAHPGSNWRTPANAFDGAASAA